jgi:hypothetical protein
LIRLGDLLDLQPTDRRRGWLYVADPKADEPYEIALSRRAMQALDALPVTGKYYFQRYRGAKTDRDRRARVRRMLMKLCAKAHVPYGKKGGGITFHWATRRSGATRLLVKQNAPLPAVQRQGNWKTPAVLLAIYAEADRQDQQDAVFPKRSRPTRKSGVMIEGIGGLVRRSQRGGREFEPPAVHQPFLSDPGRIPARRPSSIGVNRHLSLPIIPDAFPCLDVNERMSR